MPEDPVRQTITLVLHPFEQLATRNGPKIAASLRGRPLGELSASSSKLQISIEPADTLHFAFVGASGEPTDVSWTQSVDTRDPHVPVMQPWREPERDASWSVVAWARPVDSQRLLGIVERRRGAITVASPIWWTINGEGNLATNSDPNLVAQLRSKRVAIWPAVQGFDADGLHAAIIDAASRRLLAARISSEAEQQGADGVNIDLEGYRQDDADAAASFVEELAERVHGWGGVVSYDMVPRSDPWGITPESLSHWSHAPQRRRLAAAVDHVILMAYDQHNRHRPAGPVAALNWTEEVLVYQLRYSDPSSVILGIPAYGLIWRPENINAPRAVPLRRLTSEGGSISFDPAHGMDRVAGPDGSFWWMENDLMGMRLEIARGYGLGGVAVWRVGFDYPELWKALKATSRASRRRRQGASREDGPD